MVSIIIPAYNAENTIKKCLNSVCSQTFSDLQIIVVNDGSSDNTLSVIECETRGDPRVEIVNQNNSGVSHARNVGLKNSKGEFVFFLDSDDYISGDAIELLLSAALSKSADMAACEMLDEGGTAASISTFSKLSSFYANTRESIGSKLLYLRPSSACGKLMKTDIIERNGLRFNEDISIGEDLVFTHEYICCCESILKEGSAAYYVQNVNDGSLSKKYVSNSEEAVQRRNDAIKRAFKLYPEYEKEWYHYFLDVDVFGYVWFMQNLSLKGSPYSFIQKIKIIREFLNRNDCAVEVKNLKPECGPKNWTDRLYCFFISLNKSLPIVMLFDSKEIVRSIVVLSNKLLTHNQ